jgi:CrcB protein
MTQAMIGTLMAVAGGLGALLRFEISSRVSRHGHFPFGTLVVNTTGAIVTGFAAANGLAPAVHAILVTGFLGGFTTFSTWMVETAHLLEREPKVTLATLNVVAMIALGLVGAAIGITIGG